MLIDSAEIFVGNHPVTLAPRLCRVPPRQGQGSAQHDGYGLYLSLRHKAKGGEKVFETFSVCRAIQYALGESKHNPVERLPLGKPDKFWLP